MRKSEAFTNLLWVEQNLKHFQDCGSSQLFWFGPSFQEVLIGSKKYKNSWFENSPAFMKGTEILNGMKRYIEYWVLIPAVKQLTFTWLPCSFLSLQIYCCLGALSIADSLHYVNADMLGWWLCERQLPSGGLNGEKKWSLLFIVWFKLICPSVSRRWFCLAHQRNKIVSVSDCLIFHA